VPSYDKWTRLQLRTLVRKELLDPNGRWWSDAELNTYLDDWQDTIQDRVELVWGTATLTLSTSTIALSTLSDMRRLDAVYLNNRRLPYRTHNDLETLQREWRDSTGSPTAVFQPSPATLAFWPPLSTSASVIFEYPKALAFGSDASYMELPAFTKYSAVPYCCHRAYLRLGPNQDLNRALRRKKQFEQAVQAYTSTYAHYFPYRAPHLKPISSYEANILNPTDSGSVTVPMAISNSFTDEIPTGAINGTNTIFTLSVLPTEVQVYKNGLLQHDPNDYSRSGLTLTFTANSIPETGDTLIAWIFRT
jgi:hypothetical protein